MIKNGAILKEIAIKEGLIELADKEYLTHKEYCQIMNTETWQKVNDEIIAEFGK